MKRKFSAGDRIKKEKEAEYADEVAKVNRSHRAFIDSRCLVDILEYAVLREVFDLKGKIIESLRLYREEAREAFMRLPEREREEFKPDQVYLLPNYTHYDQLWERMKFLTELSKRTGQANIDLDLEKVFNICNESGDKILDTDMQVFFTWCSKATVAEPLKNFRTDADG